MVTLSEADIYKVMTETGATYETVVKAAAGLDFCNYMFPCIRALIAILPLTKLQAVICCITRQKPPLF